MNMAPMHSGATSSEENTPLNNSTTNTATMDSGATSSSSEENTPLNYLTTKHGPDALRRHRHLLLPLQGERAVK